MLQVRINLTLRATYCGEGSKRGLDAFIEIVNDFAEVTHGHGHHRNGEQDPQREWG